MDQDGWNSSAAAWIADLGETGDAGRATILDAPMLARLGEPGLMLDIGCGEGRFCRMAQARGFKTIGIDPTKALLDVAKLRDPEGDYRAASAENLPVADENIDLAVFYLSLIDIPDIRAAISDMARVLKPGGRCLLANLTSYNTASLADNSWNRSASGATNLTIDNYLKEYANWTEWRGIRIRNWHRPMTTYMQLFLNAGMQLVHFDEPPSHHPDPEQAEHYNRAPYFLIMEWVKPG